MSVCECVCVCARARTHTHTHTHTPQERLLPCTSGHLYLSRDFWRQWQAGNARVQRVDFLDDADLWGRQVVGETLRFSVFAHVA